MKIIFVNSQVGLVHQKQIDSPPKKFYNRWNKMFDIITFLSSLSITLYVINW